MGILKQIITVHAINTAKNSDFKPYPVDIEAIGGIDPLANNDDELAERRDQNEPCARIDLKYLFNINGQIVTAHGSQHGRINTACSSLLVRESAEEIIKLIEEKEEETLEKLRKYKLSIF